MNQVLEKNRTASGEAVAGLVKSLNYLENLQEELVRFMRSHPHGHPDDMLAIHLARCVGHLRDAVGELPDDMLAQTFAPIAPTMSSARRLAAEEVLARLTKGVPA
jgi:hypothetical protein